MNWIIGLNGLIYLGFGVAGLIDPVLLLSSLGIVLNATGMIEIRAMYGGLEVGIALFLFLCIYRGWQEAGIVFCVWSIVGLWSGRLGSSLLFDGASPLVWKLVAIESFATGVNVFFCWRFYYLKRQSKAITV